MDAGKLVRGLAAGVAIVLLGACGMTGVIVTRALYEDHQLLEKIRENDRQQLINAAQQVQKFQQQQGQQAPAGPAPTK